MKVVIDGDVEAVPEMMIKNIPADKLVVVANAVQKIAPTLWGQFEVTEIQPISLKHSAILPCDQHMQSFFI